ncbi:hypothetical protein EVAR_57984_1 [Eumeta japonica]|uniref:MADF domain-containing protein n=1 Tax=Eumeta variegata TaxID=151549 RepID=A0A4C1XXU4_EUMVA|nr:hypothetical protein EVAR_57984_1 [Eumeta japonica]
MKWTNALTLKFVKIYFKRDVLWDPANPVYSLNFIREAAYADVIAEFEAATSKTLTIKEILKKLKELNLIYLKETYKMLQKARSGEIYKPSPVWFKEMDKHLKDLPSTHRTLCMKAEELRDMHGSNKVKKSHKTDPKSVTKMKKGRRHTSKSSKKFEDFEDDTSDYISTISTLFTLN